MPCGVSTSAYLTDAPVEGDSSVRPFGGRCSRKEPLTLVHRARGRTRSRRGRNTSTRFIRHRCEATRVTSHQLALDFLLTYPFGAVRNIRGASDVVNSPAERPREVWRHRPTGQRWVVTTDMMGVPESAAGPAPSPRPSGCCSGAADHRLASAGSKGGWNWSPSCGAARAPGSHAGVVLPQQNSRLVTDCAALTAKPRCVLAEFSRLLEERVDRNRSSRGGKLCRETRRHLGTR